MSGYGRDFVVRVLMGSGLECKNCDIHESAMWILCLEDSGLRIGFVYDIQEILEAEKERCPRSLVTLGLS